MISIRKCYLYFYLLPCFHFSLLVELGSTSSVHVTVAQLHLWWRSDFFCVVEGHLPGTEMCLFIFYEYISCLSSPEQSVRHSYFFFFFFLFGWFRQYCRLFTHAGVLSCLWKLRDCLTESCLSVCLSAFACELQIAARQQRACSRQRQGFALSSAPRSRLWVLCHMTLSEIDPLLTSRSCCATQSFIWCCSHQLKDESRSSPPPKHVERGGSDPTPCYCLNPKFYFQICFVRLLGMQFLSQDHKTGRIACVLGFLKWFIW